MSVPLLAVALVGGTGVLPMSAQATVPSVATRSVEVAGTETAIIKGDAEPGGPLTTVYVAYGLAAGSWCASDGHEGTAMQTIPAVLGSGETIYEVSITVGGLGRETSYCAELAAQNQDGTAYGGQVRFITLAHSTFPPEPSSPPIPENNPTPFVSEPPAWIGGSVGAASQELAEAAERRRHEAEEQSAAEQHHYSTTARCVAPVLREKTLKVARAVLRGAHCRLGAITKATPTRQDLVVVAQSPRAGRALSKNAPVAVRLGLRQAKATQRRRDLGLLEEFSPAA